MGLLLNIEKSEKHFSNQHSKFTNKSLRSLIIKVLVFFCILFFFTTSIHAEGTKTWQPDPNSKSDLYITPPSSNAAGVRSFAGYLSQPNMKMYIHIENTNNEMVYIGLSGSGYEFRIVSPTGAVVHGPFTVNAPNANSHALATAGPDILNASGYPTTNAMFKFDPTGLPSGDYSVEFKTSISMPWFDITVATKDATPLEIQGRLWSQAWQVNCGSFTAALKAMLYARDEAGYVTQINFAEAGIKPYVGQFSFNDTGTGSSGNVAEDRKSVDGQQAGNPVQKIFLNQPDPNVYPLGADGELQNLPLKVENPANPNITIEVSQPGRVEVVLDFGTIGDYSEAVDKRLFMDVTTGTNTLVWDGLRGDGQKVQPRDYPVPVTISYTQGETHFTAYDVEYLDESFVVRTQTTAGLTNPNTLFWDDSNIPDIHGIPPNLKTNTDVGSVARQPWSTKSFGDLNTINTWWFSYRDYLTSTILMPGDYGDAPNSYGGAAHKVLATPTIYLGTLPPDEENYVATPIDGTGDDTDGIDDEDAISSFPELTIADSTYTLPANSITVTNTSGATVKMYAYIDFNNNGVFTDAGESISVDVLDGATNPATDLVFSGFSKATTGGTIYARFRIASTESEISQPTSGASDGEVEDYPLALLGIDYGDAPSTYGDSFHILPATSLLYLGATAPDGESQSQNSVNGGADGSGDDNTGTDDEDGVTVGGNDLQGQSLSLGESYTFDTEINGSGVLNAWFDWNGDGDFNDTGEHVIQEKGVSTGTSSSSFSIPGIVQLGDTYARFRVCPAAGQCNDPASSTQGGEIEDYSITIELSQPKSCVVGNTLTVGSAIISNTGPNGTSEYQITPDQNNQAGALWGKEKVTLLAPFDLTMFVYAGNKDAWGADGFAFLFHNDPRGTTTLGDLGGGIGYGGIKTGFVVEFDTWRNTNDPVNDHTAVSLSGKGIALDPYSTAQHIMPVKDLGDIEDDKYHLVRLVWEPITQTFSYYFDGELLASKNIDLVSQVGESALWGFTASTGGAKNRHAACFQDIFPPITNDYSDAPDSYGGANHYLPQGGNVFLGNTPPDSESGISLGADNGATASGDDTSGDDEDGVSNFNVLTDANTKYSVEIKANNPLSKVANVMSWIDFDGNGTFDSDEASDLATVPAGTNNGSVTLNWSNIPTDIKIGNSFIRLRITTDAMTATDTIVFKMDGEVEDYSLAIVEPDFDYGDAPDSGAGTSTGNYQTLLADNGPRHVYPPPSSLFLGTAPDTDLDGQPSALADGDGADEDGIVVFETINDLATSYTVSANVSNNSGSPANLMAWVDYDRNGLFDADEASAVVTIPTGTNNSNVDVVWNSVPTDISVGDTFVRFRITTSPITTTDSVGLLSEGEVEDYPLTIEIGGFPVKGRVYKDTNINATNDGTTEKGISGLPVVLVKIEPNPADNTCVSTKTRGDGNYTFFPVIPGKYQLYEASREAVKIPKYCDIAKAKDPAGYRSTTANVLAEFDVVDAEITGKDFGDINDPVFTPNNSSTVLAGNVVFYAHKFTPPSTGTVTFTSTNAATITSGWSNVIYQDTDCNGKLDGAEANTPVGVNLATTANIDICLINKVYAPTAVSSGETYANVISAAFDFNGNALAGAKTLKVTDLTKAAANAPVTPSTPTGGNSKLVLRKTVQNMTQAGSQETEKQNQAKPGDVLKYRIYYSNVGNAPLTDLIINDTVPDFTSIVGSPVCQMPLPASLSSCTPTVTSDDIAWTFPASDTLKAGTGGEVSYEVTID